MINDVGYFYMLIQNLYLFFGEISVQILRLWVFFLFVCFVYVLLFRATPEVYGGSQARG